MGPVAEQLGHSFDQYWNSALSRPIGDFLWRQPDAHDLHASRHRLEVSLAEARTRRKALYDRLMAYQSQPRLDVWRNELIWAHSQALWDAPSKVLANDEPDPQLLLTQQLAPDLNNVRHELILVSAYFVPGESGLLYLTHNADAGISVKLLTNSLEATDVPAVHGGYAPYRRALLEHGVKLYELRRQPGDPSAGRLSFHGGSDSSLHSKAIVFDRRKTFIGSFNFDPRSVLWNTEVGVLVDSPELAEYTRALAVQGMAPALSYQPQLRGDKLVWVTEEDGKQRILTSEPGGMWRRFNAWVSKAVGLEKML
ncbi:putative cardiolipin synthase YbhO [compost metagenome]